jgi:hypothetical protein
LTVRFWAREVTEKVGSKIMKHGHTEDKQLQGIALEAVLEKQRLGQAMNAKEFAVCAGVSYSTARSWFRLPGFPAFHGVIFWQDFVQWRTGQNGFASQSENLPHHHGVAVAASSGLPPRAAQILLEASSASKSLIS